MDEMSKRADVSGTVVSYTTIYIPTPEFAGETPYGLAVAETASGERLLARVAGVTERPLEIGGRVVYDHDDAHGAVYRVG